MSVLSRSLIAAAGNAAGGLSYWVDRVQTPSSRTPFLRASLDTTNQKISIVGSEQTIGRYLVELDYDGGLIDASLFNSGGAQYSTDFLTIDSDRYFFIPKTSAQLTVTDVGSVNSSLFDSIYWNLNAQSGTSNYDAHSSFASYDQETVSDLIVITRGGYTSVYFTGYGTYYKSKALTFTYNPTNNTTTNQKTIQGSFEPSGYGARNAIISNSFGQDYCLFWNDPSANPYGIGFAKYTTATTPTPTTDVKFSVYFANFKNIGVFLDSENKMSAVGAVTTSFTRVFRGNTAGDYKPDFAYDFSHGVTLGNLVSTAMDSEKNIYLLYQNNYLVKFSSSNTIEWCLNLDNTLVGLEPATYISEVKVESIDDTEFLLLSLVYPRESGQPFCWYIVKAPIDLNNYLGTYGNIQISSFSFSPSITITNINNNFIGPPDGIEGGMGSQVTLTESNTAQTLTVITSDI